MEDKYYAATKQVESKEIIFTNLPVEKRFFCGTGFPNTIIEVKIMAIAVPWINLHVKAKF